MIVIKAHYLLFLLFSSSSFHQRQLTLTVGFLRTLSPVSINPFHQRQLATNLRLNLS